MKYLKIDTVRATVVKKYNKGRFPRLTLAKMKGIMLPAAAVEHTVLGWSCASKVCFVHGNCVTTSQQLSREDQLAVKLLLDSLAEH